MESYYLCEKYVPMKRILGVFLVVITLILAGGCMDKEEPAPQQKTPPPIQQ